MFDKAMAWLLQVWLQVEAEAAALVARLAALWADPEGRGALTAVAAGAALTAWLLAWAVRVRPRTRRLRQAREAAAARAAEAAERATALALAESRAAEAEALRPRFEAEARRSAALEAELAAARREAEARLADLRVLGQSVERRFESLAGEALGRNAEAVVALAAERLGEARRGAAEDLARRQEGVAALLAPLAERLERFDSRLGEIERAREGAYAGVLAQVGALAEGQSRLGRETDRLARALRTPHARGRWGEMQLRRVFELAGMAEHVDFETEVTVAGETGAQRPDAVIRLPGGRSLAVDAKTPLDAYLAAVEAEDEATRAAETARHARHLRTHVQTLGAKAYWRALPEAPDFVVLFVPGEAMLAAALEAAPDLFEEAIRRRVLLASPATLVALARTVAHGWRDAAMAENAREIADCARDLFERIRVFGDHLDGVGRSLRQTVERYNGAVGSFDARLLAAARRLETLGAAPAGREPPQVGRVETLPRLALPRAAE